MRAARTFYFFWYCIPLVPCRSRLLTVSLSFAFSPSLSNAHRIASQGQTIYPDSPFTFTIGDVALGNVMNPAKLLGRLT